MAQMVFLKQEHELTSLVLHAKVAILRFLWYAMLLAIWKLIYCEGFVFISLKWQSPGAALQW